MPLAFVNRHAEALDVLYPNLANQEALRRGAVIKFAMPLASQPPGAGKTALGSNITNIMHRPREDRQEEQLVAERLTQAWCLGGQGAGAIARARRDARDENLVMRMLLGAYSQHSQLLLQLKATQPVVVVMQTLVAPHVLPMGGFDAALAYAIFAAAHNLNADDSATFDHFMTLPRMQQTAAGIVTALVKRGPLMLVLDDITELAMAKFTPYFADQQRSTPLHRAMKELSSVLQNMHRVHGCLIYCTGRSLWLSTRALMRASSPLIVHPTLLHALTAADVIQAFRSSSGVTGPTLLHDMGLEDELVTDFAHTAVRLTGGIGRALQFLLRARQHAFCTGSPKLTARGQVYAALDTLQPLIADIPGMLLRVNWDGPRTAVAEGDVPAWLQREKEQVMLLQLFTRMLLLDTAFTPRATVRMGGHSVRLTDAAVVLGLTCTTSPIHKRGNMLRLVASDWLCRSIVLEPQLQSERYASPFVSAQLLAVVRSFGGTMRGRPFELLCADALCHRAAVSVGTRWSSLLPHVGTTCFASERVRRLQVVAIPKVTSDASLLTDTEKAQLLASRSAWRGSALIHPLDLPWLLQVWLPVGSLGIPADAASGSQDFFVRFEHSVCGIALKAVGAEAATAWASVREEIDKAPRLTDGMTYTLLLWSLTLAPQLQRAMDDSASRAFGTGAWSLHESALTQRSAAVSQSRVVFTVPPAMDLLIANPSPAGGLSQLLGDETLSAIRSCVRESGGDRLRVDILAEWAPLEATLTVDDHQSA